MNKHLRVLLNMLTDYNARLLASDIKTYFYDESQQNSPIRLNFGAAKSRKSLFSMMSRDIIRPSGQIIRASF